MTPGRVVRLRVNSLDCLACVDVARKIGLYVNGMSFAQLVSVTLATLLETARQSGTIPTRDGFEWAEMMAQFPDSPKQDRAKKIQITKALSKLTGRNLTGVEKTRKQVRFEELAFKAEHDELNLSAADRAELAALVAELFPEPKFETQS